ncbi:hypothetical protein Tcan_03322 [Toxocara canis]|uniref:Uncharacterized protein n=2 Tax=Toxocara canis TaxID=6265 RepID=A0A0B2VRQ9_TOXCA|nr:hypothetical protein Tcan_03322 [Toxocara canis]VDM26235.1 unnamed protein product [Toxocara canis]
MTDRAALNWKAASKRAMHEPFRSASCVSQKSFGALDSLPLKHRDRAAKQLRICEERSSTNDPRICTFLLPQARRAARSVFDRLASSSLGWGAASRHLAEHAY